MKQFLWLLGIVLLDGCHDSRTIYQYYYGSETRQIAAISIGTVSSVESAKAKVGLSPSVIQPDRIATVENGRSIRGEAPPDKFSFAFESRRNGVPEAGSTYLFLWDAEMRCLGVLAVKGEKYVRDGVEYPISRLSLSTNKP